MSKKAEGLSIQVIITAAIALVVLVVLLYLVFRGIGPVDNATRCEGTVAGICADECATLGDNYIENAAYNGKTGGCADQEVCCVSKPGVEE